MRKILRAFVLIATALTVTLPIHAESAEYDNQRNRGAIRGTVKGPDNEPVDFATILIRNTRFHALTNDKGEFLLNLPAGTYRMVVSQMGYESREETVTVQAGEKKILHIRLESKSIGIDKIEVNGKSEAAKVNESAFNVVAVDLSNYHNSSLELAGVLDRVSGVRVRESGGLGSGASVQLNGFSGRHVKLFLDGVPLQGSGSSFGINNIPVNMAERIEVYKGVVPITLGADALGGAINIVTKNTANTFLDASYSYGSFDTHKSNVSLGHTTKSGVSFQLTGYQNYSKNNYRVKTQLLDLETSTYSEEKYWFRRFHNTYHNEAVSARVGVRNKPWATRLMAEITLSQEDEQIQNGNLMKVVYGEKKHHSKSVIPSLVYDKYDLFTEGLNLSFTARYNHSENRSIDTSAYRYNWAGERKLANSAGEGIYTDSKSRNNNLHLTGNLNYRLAEKHFLSVNHVFSDFSRNNTGSTSADATADIKRTSTKNVMGISYKFGLDAGWNASAFYKYYGIKVTGPIDVSTSTSTSTYEEQNRSYRTSGYGLATTYFINRSLQLKASYEKAYRLPTERELFGDEVLETGDAALKPEHSNNVNLNLTFDHAFGRDHSVLLDVGLIYRNTRDYIRRQVEQRYGGAYYTNHGKVLNYGIDLEARYFYKRSFNIGGNLTYQDIRNKERYGVNGNELIYYNDRMPNQPYLFSNVDASYTFFDLLGMGNRLTLGYHMQYIYEFYTAWKSVAGTDGISVPTQFSHDVTVNYSMKNGRYNIAFEARNLFDEMLFDNYSLQKPGRSFNVKVRYYLFKSR